MTATTDLAALAQEIGGDKVYCGVRRTRLPGPAFRRKRNQVFLLKLRHADLLIVVGPRAESGWLPPLITQSTNTENPSRRPGYFDVSRFARFWKCRRARSPRAKATFIPQGNTHYWLDPDTVCASPKHRGQAERDASRRLRLFRATLH